MLRIQSKKTVLWIVLTRHLLTPPILSVICFTLQWALNSPHPYSPQPSACLFHDNLQEEQPDGTRTFFELEYYVFNYFDWGLNINAALGPSQAQEVRLVKNGLCFE